MTEDPLEIPAFLDRRNDPKMDLPPLNQPRQWIMPSNRRIRAAQNKRVKEHRATKRLEAEAIKKADASPDTIDTASDVGKVKS